MGKIAASHSPVAVYASSIQLRDDCAHIYRTSAKVSKNSRSYLTISLAGFFGSSSYSATFCCTCDQPQHCIYLRNTESRDTWVRTCFLTANPAPLPNPAKGFALLPPGRKDRGRNEISSVLISSDCGWTTSRSMPSFLQDRSTAAGHGVGFCSFRISNSLQCCWGLGDGLPVQ